MWKVESGKKTTLNTDLGRDSRMNENNNKKTQLGAPFPTWLAAPGEKKNNGDIPQTPAGKSAIYGKKWKTAPPVPSQNK